MAVSIYPQETLHQGVRSQGPDGFTEKIRSSKYGLVLPMKRPKKIPDLATFTKEKRSAHHRPFTAVSTISPGGPDLYREERITSGLY